jgi:hypothetical protein
VLEGIEAIMFGTVGDGPSSWEALLPPELPRLPEELARVDALPPGVRRRATAAPSPGSAARLFRSK